MTANYQWDETRIRERIEALGLILAIDLNAPDRFIVLDRKAEPVAVIYVTPRGFDSITAEPDPSYFPINTPDTEQQYFRALAAKAGASS